jgi:hypothetical protein
VKKSKAMFFGKPICDNFAPLLLNNCAIEYVSYWKYLGATIISGKCFGFSSKSDLISFYRASNSLLNVLTKPSEQILLQLLYELYRIIQKLYSYYMNCVPIITYACAVKEFSAQEMSQCTVAVNDAIRKIFGFKRWESTRELRTAFGYKSVYELFAAAKKQFELSCFTHDNSIITFLASLFLK